MAEYTINTPQGDLKINVPGGWATEDTLKGLVRALAGDRNRQNKANEKLKDFAKTLDKNNRRSITNQVQDTADEFGDLSDELTKTQKGLKALGGALETAGGIAQGVLAGTGRLTDINPIVDDVSVGLGKVAQVAGGFEFLGISASAAVEAVVELTRSFTQLSTQIGQQVIDTFDTLIGQGAGVGFNFDDIGETAAEAKIGLEALNSVVRDNAAGVIAFGGDLETGLTRFLQVTNIANNELREDFRALGMSTTETAEFLGEFLSSQRTGLLQNRMTNDEVANSALNLNRELQILAELTGQDVDALKAEVMQRNIEVGARVKLARLEMEGVEGAAQAFDLLRSSVPESIKPLVAQLLEFDAAFGDMAPLNAFPGLVGDLNKGIDDIFSDDTLSIDERNKRVTDLVEQVQNNLVDIAERGDLGQLGELAGLIGDATLDTFGAVLLDAFDQRALTLQRGIVQGGEDEQDFNELLRQQQEQTLKTIQNAEGVIGSLMQSVMAIEDARSEFEAALLSQAGTILPMVGGAIVAFYKALGAPFGIDIFDDAEELPTGDNDVDQQIISGFDVLPGDQEAAREFYKNLMAPEENFLGGTIMPNTTSLVGEMGPELITTGNAGGEVVNNATTSDIMGAANAVMNGIGGNNSNQTLEALQSIARDQSDTKRLLQKILPKAMTSNGFF